jgi:hypothetical protein
MMKSILGTLLFILVSLTSFSQARMVFDGNIGLAMYNGTSANKMYVVIDNQNSNAITDFGAFGGPAIRSESEFNIVKWNIKNATGTYNVPFIYPTTARYVAPSVTISAAGDAAGHINFATYHTNASNSVWPTDVSHLSHFPGGPETTSNTTADRFWIIDPVYTTKPSLSQLAINFDPSELDGIPIGAFNIVLQRFNSDAYAGGGAWMDYIPPVTNTPLAAGPLTFIQVGPIANTNFFRSWAISNGATPLPITLTRFYANCQGSDKVDLTWVTASEINNDYFTLERSEDGIIWEAFDMIQGAGNSSSELTYKSTDYNPFSGITYYRLTQTDFNGASETFDPIVSDCDGVGVEIIAATSLEASPMLDLVVSSGSNESFDIELYDMSGKQVMRKSTIALVSGLNYFSLDKGDLGKGIYIINMTSATQQMTRKEITN